jgi:hypothetical protein
MIGDIGVQDLSDASLHLRALAREIRAVGQVLLTDFKQTQDTQLLWLAAQLTRFANALDLIATRIRPLVLTSTRPEESS